VTDHAQAVLDHSSYGYRRLIIHYERKPSHYVAFLILGAITCYKKLAKRDTLLRPPLNDAPDNQPNCQR
jgi:hypothetical protein